ncbi:hypothetical protein GLYMA_02G238051v4 [Glycine max]|nr:hypothetical protein GLYMA_02G238051v4 [Glycine max]
MRLPMHFLSLLGIIYVILPLENIIMFSCSSSSCDISSTMILVVISCSFSDSDSHCFLHVINSTHIFLRGMTEKSSHDNYVLVPRTNYIVK